MTSGREYKSLLGVCVPLLMLVVFLCWICAAIAGQRDADRLHAADLQAQLDKEKETSSKLLSDNIALRTEAGENSLMMFRAADLLEACVKKLPPGTRVRVRVRRFDPSAADGDGTSMFPMGRPFPQ